MPQLRSQLQHQHVLTHTGNNPLVCPICKETFSMISRLQLHLFWQCGRKLGEGTVHQEAFTQQDLQLRLMFVRARHFCNVCNHAFRHWSAFLLHLRIHSPVKPYVCGICHKAFFRSIKLRKHLSIHNGRKPHVCDTCNTPFPNRSSLKRHLIIHSAEKSYVCEVCRKVFNQKANHDAHALTHKFEKCAIKSDFDEHYENGRAH